MDDLQDLLGRLAHYQEFEEHGSLVGIFLANRGSKNLELIAHEHTR
jgi:hypothetical protein